MSHLIEEKLEPVLKMKNELIDLMKSELAKGAAMVDTKEAGEVIDMIKDLAETEYYCMKAWYYEYQIEAMRGEEEHGRMGYGKGKYPTYPMRPPYDADGFDYDMIRRMGYKRTEQPDHLVPNPYYEPNSEYGKTYNEYKNARRHYTDTKSASDKVKMDDYAKKHVMESIDTIRDIWKDSDPELKRKMKADLQTVLNEMTV